MAGLSAPLGFDVYHREWDGFALCIAPFAEPDFRSIVLGNVLEKSLAEVWNGDRYQELRRAVLSEAPGAWPCKFCGVKWSL